MRIGHSFLSFLSMLNQTTIAYIIFFDIENAKKHEFSMSINHSFLSFLSMLNQTTDSRFIFFSTSQNAKSTNPL